MLELPLDSSWTASEAPTMMLESVEVEEFDLEMPSVSDLPLIALDAPEPAVELAAPSRVAAEPEPVMADASLSLLDLGADALEEHLVAVATAIEPEVPAVKPAPVAPAAPVPAAAADDCIDLGDWLRETEAPRSTRMVTAEPSQTGDEQADFERMLDAFKAGVERNIDGEDFDSHYDLGVAFREMGLLDEAVTQFQRASRAPGRPLRAIEALGQCFIDLGQPELALESLRRAIPDGASGASVGALPDEQLVGVLYLLGVASEQTQRTEAAGAYYRRVLATDIQFRDAGRRLAQLPPPQPTR